MIHPKTHHNPSIIAKDAFRGIRFALKRGAKMLVQNGPRQLPKQFEAASSDFLHGVKKLTGTVDRIVKLILGLAFDEKSFQAPYFATANDQNTSQEQMSLDASNLYFALTLSANHLGVKDLLVSEALCARLIAEDASFDWPLGQQSTEALSAELFKRLIATNVLGDPPGVGSSHNNDHFKDVVTISFATALWVYVQRGAFDDTELEILRICADVAAKMNTKIMKNRASDDELLSLFKYALETV
jgi:hypothetical protein